MLSYFCPYLISGGKRVAGRGRAIPLLRLTDGRPRPAKYLAGRIAPGRGENARSHWARVQRCSASFIARLTRRADSNRRCRAQSVGCLEITPLTALRMRPNDRRPDGGATSRSAGGSAATFAGQRAADESGSRRGLAGSGISPCTSACGSLCGSRSAPQPAGRGCRMEGS